MKIVQFRRILILLDTFYISWTRVACQKIRPQAPQGANTLKLIEELGLEHKLKPIKYGHPATVNRMVYVDGKLHKLPSSFKSLFIPQLPFSKACSQLTLFKDISR